MFFVFFGLVVLLNLINFFKKVCNFLGWGELKRIRFIFVVLYFGWCLRMG